jgi:TolB-like protein/DNA-binding winged helix-turn-helix (wHTH) protein/Tfp pilus assembly protein PilF
MAASEMLRFGDFELDPSTGALRRAGAPVKLAPQPAKALEVLAQRAGDVVSREELRQAVWGSETFVDFEAGLNSCIKQIRAAIGPGWVETLPKRGYRFINHQDTKAPRRAWIVAAMLPAVLGVLGVLVVDKPRGNERHLLVVLPFANLGAEEYFADGLTDELITQLGRLQPARLGVIARTSAMQYRGTRKTVPQIAAELGVDYIVEGSVRQEGSRVRISAKLIQAADQAQLWAAAYERDSSEALAIQSQVARRVAGSLALELLPGSATAWRAITANPQAHDAYLRGLHRLAKRSEPDFRAALDYFQRAAREDPGFALAHVGVADTYSLLGEYYLMPPKSAFPLAKEAAQRALALDDTLAEAHTSLAFVLAKYEWDWRAAETRFQRALELNPGYATAHQWYAELLSATGRHEEALAAVRRAQQLDPLSLIIQSVTGYLHYNARRYDEAIEQCRQVLARDPHFLPALQFLMLAYERKGLEAESLALERVYVEQALRGMRSVSFRKPRGAEIRQDTPPYSVAASYAALGQKEQALRWLDRAYREHDALITFARVDPGLDPVRRDPRFAGLLRKLGL